MAENVHVVVPPPPIVPYSSPNNPQWYQELPSWTKVFVQLGFASLVAVLFYMDSRDRSIQLQDFQQESRSMAREDRQFYREDSAAYRAELKEMREDLRSVAATMRDAIGKLNDNHQKLKKEVESIIPNLIPSPVPKIPFPKD